MTARERYETLSPSERARWLDPAEIEFCDHGFEKASLNRIIANADESKGRTYHYFDNKGDLFRAVFERCLDRHLALSAALDAAMGAERDAFWARLRTVNAQLTEIFQTDSTLAAMLRTLHQEAAAQAACAAPLDAFRQKTESVLAAGQKIGAVRHDLPLSLMAEVALNLLITVDRWFAVNTNDLTAQQESDLSDRAFAMLKAPFLPHPQEGHI